MAGRLYQCRLKELCSFLHELKVPTGYCANTKRLVNMKELTFNMSCVKAHDCHVMMIQLLLVAMSADALTQQ